MRWRIWVSSTLTCRRRRNGCGGRSRTHPCRWRRNKGRGGKNNMYAFEYHRPTSLGDAVSLVSGNDDAKIIAGGQTLIPTLKQRLAQPSDVIDLGAIAELRGIREEAAVS